MTFLPMIWDSSFDIGMLVTFSMVVTWIFCHWLAAPVTR